jgi:hypothetical protein
MEFPRLASLKDGTILRAGGGDMSRYTTFVIVIAAVLAGGFGVWAQTRPATLDEKRAAIDKILYGAEYRNRMTRRDYVARCPECAELAARINVLSEQHSNLYSQISGLENEDRQLAEQFTANDAALREATRRADAAAAAQARTRLDQIVARRVAISGELPALRSQFTDVGLELFTKILELEKCEAACFQPDRQGGPGGDPGSGTTPPDLAVNPIPGSPGAECKECQDIADLLAGARAADEKAGGYLSHLSTEVEALDREIARLAAAGDARAWRAAGAKAVAMAQQYSLMLPRARQLSKQVSDLEQQLRKCNFEICRKGKWTDPPGTGPGSGATGATGGATHCASCLELSEQIQALEAELAELRQRRAAIEENQKAVQELRAKATTQSQRDGLDGQMQQLNRRHGETSGQEQSKMKELEALQGSIDGCDQDCGEPPPPPPPQPPNTAKPATSAFRDPRVIGGAAGGAVLVALLAGGGDTAAPVTPVASQPPPAPQQPQSPQQPQPPQEPQPTIAGVADCTACAPTDDPGRHNLVINLCPQLTGPFEISVASITIRHRSPFVDIIGAQYDTTSGAFRGTARGTVAGFPNVGISADGTANAQTGTVVFNYTMGTGGELPGGRPITYRITLQKRR